MSVDDRQVDDGLHDDLEDEGLEKQQEPLYDLPADDEQSDDDEPEEASGGRDLRDSVSAGFLLMSPI
jgi:hypothetical protein